MLLPLLLLWFAGGTGREDDGGGGPDPAVVSTGCSAESFDSGIGGCTTLNIEPDDFPAKKKLDYVYARCYPVCPVSGSV